MRRNNKLSQHEFVVSCERCTKYVTLFDLMS